MNVNAIFPSNYLKAADLKGAQVRVVIDRVTMETFGQGPQANERPVIYFEGKEKGLVANKTNMGTIAAAYGDETDEWQGAEIILFESMVDYQGKSMPAIRVKIPPRKPGNAPAKPVPHPTQDYGRPAMSAIVDDDIPFMWM